MVHLGGGISIGAHRNGKVVDVNHAIGGEGPFSPERAGSVSVIDAVRLAYSGKYYRKRILQNAHRAGRTVLRTLAPTMLMKWNSG